MKLLLIEDDISIRNVLRLSLENHDFVVDEAEDGEKGSYLARCNQYDVIILDQVMPKKLGSQVCREIRESENHTPIIMLTQKDEINLKVDLFSYGADDYMTKPFSFEELLARLNALLRRPKKIEENIIKIGDITLNRERHLIKKGSEKIDLTRKEFLLLNYLMRHKGLVISRGMILENVWEMEVDPFSNTIEAHILCLRKKLKDRSKSLIRTIPGRGYMINDLKE